MGWAFASLEFSYPKLVCSIVVGVDPLSDAPVLRGDTFQEVIVHVEADAQWEERELLPHHPLHILLDGAELDLTYENQQTAYLCLGADLCGRPEMQNTTASYKTSTAVVFCDLHFRATVIFKSRI